MVAKKGGGGRGGASATEESVEELSRVPLQAILLADSFATRFRPITLECPKVLLPLVNVPMIDYTLAWLESAGIEEVFVFCCAHSKQVIQHLEASKWFNQPGFLVTTIESNNSAGPGDALRLIFDQNVIRGDFVLVSGDTISNMSLSDALREHKERRKKDNNAIMTMVVKQSKRSPVTGQSRLGTDDELFMAIDPDTKQLLYYEDKSEDKSKDKSEEKSKDKSKDKSSKGVSLDKALASEHSNINLHNDMQDCYIDICSPEVLSTFADNFDYQHLRRHFLKGLLDDDIMGCKIFTHEIHSSYAARIDNFRSYDTVSKDIIQRWTYPFVPDIQFCGNRFIKHERNGIYRASDKGQSRSADIGPFTVIGSGTTVGNQTKISNSVVGEGCKIGSNVSIHGCYIWHNVTIEDGCKLKHAVVCDGVIIKSEAALESGVVLAYKVIVGQHFVVPAYSKVSLFRQPIKQDSDEELEYAEDSCGTLEVSSTTTWSDKLNAESTMQLSESQLKAESEVGSSGIGFIWLTSEAGQEQEQRLSVAPIPTGHEIFEQDSEIGTPPSIEDIRPPEYYSSSENEDYPFEKEVEATFLRGVHENVKEDNIVLEVNSLRLAYNVEFSDCAGALFYSILKFALNVPHDPHSELVKNTANVILKWQNLLKYYLPSMDEQIEVILKFEEMCLEESTKDYSLHFVQILHLLYDKDIIGEEAILNWAREKEGAEEADKVFLKQSEKFIQWLNEASEEASEED